MALIRRTWLPLLLAPVTIFASGQAMAAGGALPHGIHLGKHGRYYQDICDRAAGRHCFSARILPEAYVPKPQASPDAAGFCTLPNGSEPGTATTPPEGSMGPTEIATAYSVPTTTAGHGKIVAVVDMPDSTAFADLTAYRSGFSLPALPQCTGNGGLPDGTTPCFAAVNQTGTVYTATSTTDCKAADPETSLDIDMISAACPDCSIVLVQMTNASKTDGPSDQDFIDCVGTAATLGAQATSISFGGPEDINGTPDPTGNKYTTAGHLVLAASGDDGYLLEGEQGAGTSPSYPGSATDVLGVGGTLLQGASGNTFSEAVWNDQSGAGGSGCSTEFAMPSYQTAFGASKFGACTMRASCDIAAAADFLPANATKTEGGIAEYDAYNKWVQVVGTSAAAPLVGALLVRLGVAEAVSSDFGFLYTNIAAFNDVTSGTNDGFSNQTLCTAGDVICTAGAGWDGPTGVGTPNGTKLAPLGTSSGGVDAGGGQDSGSGDDDGGGSGSGSGGGSGGGLDDGGLTNGDSGVNNEFGTTPVSASCSCNAPGSSAPFENGVAIVALGGALAIFGARRRR